MRTLTPRETYNELVDVTIPSLSAVLEDIATLDPTFDAIPVAVRKELEKLIETVNGCLDRYLENVVEEYEHEED